MRLDAEAVLWLRRAAGAWLAPSEAGLRSPRDWAGVAEAARQHNLEPLLFELAERGTLVAPAEIRAAWETQYYGNQVFNLSLFETVAELLDEAAGAGIQLVALKGPVSIARHYLDPGLRVMVDLDLLCRQEDLEAAVRLAAALGFETVGENASYHLALQHPDLGAGLELHFDLYEVLARRGEFIRKVFDSSERLEVSGCGFEAPSPAADTVLQLAHILHHDRRVDLRHWLDFALAARLTRCPGGSRAPELREWLRLADLEPEFEENLAVVTRLLEADGTERRREPVAELRPEVWTSVEAALLDQEDRRAFLAGARMQAGWVDRARYVAGLLVPSPRRWRALAAAEGTGVLTALARHLRRALGRGRRKVARRVRAQSPAESPRTRLFRRRKRRDAR